MLAPLVAAAAVSILHNDSRRTADLPNVSSIAWSTNTQPSTPADIAQRQTTSLAPVDELITGLEQRLTQNPGDAKGWALLAQSHAFLGNTDRVDAAIARAIALGMDEDELRRRVDLAASSGVRQSLRVGTGQTSAPVGLLPEAL